MKPATTRTRAAETNAKTGLAAKTGTIAKTVIRKAEEKVGMKRKKFHFAISMAKIKVIGPMNAQLQLKRR